MMKLKSFVRFVCDVCGAESAKIKLGTIEDQKIDRITILAEPPVAWQLTAHGCVCPNCDVEE